ncbi:MAG: panthothenate synthetase [Chloroflexota bacterium]
MRMLMQVRFPLEPFNTLVKNGTAGRKLQQILEDIKPEAAYFFANNGQRGGILIVDVAEPSRIPFFAEPFFLTFNASLDLDPVMLPEDLGRAGLEELARKWR